MKLLIVTDHRHYRTHEGIYDTTSFDRAFFNDYRAVFEEVRVAARVRREPPPPTACRSDGDGVEFVPLPDVRKFKWVLFQRFLCGQALQEAVAWADAVCLRLPAASGRYTFRLACLMKKPVMFELLGDPSATLGIKEHGILAYLFGKIDARVIRSIVRSAVAGIYTSKFHLQQRYPPGPATVSDSISSIRLPASLIASAKCFDTPPNPLTVVLVASFVPVKCHDVLIRGVAQAKERGTSIRLKLVGDGALRQKLESLVQELGLKEDVLFLGHITDREELMAILDSSDLFAMTSASEGMPRALIEAMARGVPAIGSDVGGIAEILSPAQRFPPGDYKQLGALLADLQQNPAMLSTFAKHSEETARGFALSILSEKRKKLLSVLYDKAMESK